MWHGVQTYRRKEGMKGGVVFTRPHAWQERNCGPVGQSCYLTAPPPHTRKDQPSP